MDPVIRLPIATANADPNKVSVEKAVETLEEAAVEVTAVDKLLRLAGKTGNFADAIDAADLARIGAECVEDYERDKKGRKDWADVAERSAEAAAQAHQLKAKDYPWKGASNVKFPILTSAVLQYNARMYPAVVKGDEAILCKVIGQDEGKPEMGPDGEPAAVAPDGGPITASQAKMMPPEMAVQLQPRWRVPPGAKAKRARRVSEYLNTVLFYRMQDWESDTDSLLIQLPSVGCMFRKCWWDTQSGEPRASLVSSLRIIVPDGAKSCDTTPRLTEEIPDVWPHEISGDIRSGRFSDVDLWPTDGKGQRSREDDGPRMLLEQHRLMDLDEDGFEEPYIITVDHETQKVLRIEANFGPDGVRLNEAGEVMSIKRGKFYIKYDLLPHPQGKFYGIGLGHLLDQLGSVINTAINQLMDAGHAQTAGGGFIGSGVRLHTRGGGSTIHYEPGKYRTVDVPGDQLRSAIVERTAPNVSPVTFQVLDLIMGAARDISGAKDVITGEASNNGQVGTTLALIEQGLQVFNATAKRTFRSLKEEYTLLKDNIRKYGGEATAADYAEVLDDPEANFEADFDAKDMDIRPVSDPSSVTKMQKTARAQFLMSTMEAAVAVGGNAREILRRAYEAADIEDIEKILPDEKPQAPDPAQQAAMQAEMQSRMARAMRDQAAAGQAEAKTGETVLDTQRKRYELERQAVIDGMAMGAVA